MWCGRSTEVGLRILIVSQYFWPENFRVNDLAADLVSKGHQVTVLTGLPNYPDGHIFEDYRKQPAAFCMFKGVEIVRVPLRPRGVGNLSLILNYLSYAAMASFLGPWKLRGRAFDVIFVNQLSPVTVGIPGAVMARIKRAPMAMWVLDLWPDTLHALGVVRSPRILGWIGKLVMLIYRRCDLVLAQSKSFIPEIRKYVPASQPVEYLPSWAEDIFRSQSITQSIEIPEQEGSFDVLFAGNIGEAQDFPCILAAAEILKNKANIRWLIVGDGRMRPWVEQEVQRRGLSHQVILLGRRPVEQMPYLFQRAHALLVTLKNRPIFNMTIPGKVQSYLAAGRPIVAALNGEGAILLRRSGVGYVSDAGDDVGLADAVLRLSRLSDNERLVMGQYGKDLSNREFDRKLVLGKVEGMLKSLADGSAQKND